MVSIENHSLAKEILGREDGVHSPVQFVLVADLFQSIINEAFNQARQSSPKAALWR